jgi:hypothetical protein
MVSKPAINKPMKNKADAKLVNHRKPVYRIFGNTAPLCGKFRDLPNFLFGIVWPTVVAPLAETIVHSEHLAFKLGTGIANCHVYAQGNFVGQT